MLAAVRRAPRQIRFASVRFTSSGTEGSVARSKEFSKKEKAHEDQYVKQHEAAQLAKLRADIEKKKAELAHLENQANNIEANKKD